MENKYLTVSAITRYLKNRFDSDENLRRVYLKGEISNIKYHSTGHIYLSIKDDFPTPVSPTKATLICLGTTGFFIVILGFSIIYYLS